MNDNPWAYLINWGGPTTNGTTAILRLDFKPGKWDEYDLDFVSGTYTRREFKNSSLDDTDTGTFAVQAP